MMIGDQVIVNEGFEGLHPDDDYRYLSLDSITGKVLLVRYGPDDIQRAGLFFVPYKIFQEEKKSGNVRLEKLACRLPPWNTQLHKTSIAALDARCSDLKRSYKDRVKHRKAAIAEAISDRSAWISASDPEAELNQMARRAGQNETRYRTWVLSFLTSGCDEMAICPPFHQVGRWQRCRANPTKLGRGSIAFGRRHGSGELPELTKRYQDGYLKYVQPGRHLTKIYDLIMIKELKCTVVKGRRVGQMKYLPPPNQPIYTYDQARYRIQKLYGTKNIQANRYGEARCRTKMRPSEGRYSEKLLNLMERVEADAFTAEERPRGYIEGSVLLPLKVVTASDVLSSMGLGIGFSLGGERSDAYRMMLFCMAVPKPFFCYLFGLTIELEDWPPEGLPPNLLIDRGPGASKDLIKEWEQKLPIRDLAPAHSGQSKATVEGSHPKNDKREGAQTYTVSTLTPVALARKLIIGYISKNKTTNIEDKLEPISELALVTPSPLGYWCSLDERLRNDAQPIGIDDAIRTFLTPKKFKLREDGVYLSGRRYNSSQLKATGIFDRLMGIGEKAPAIEGYVLDLCVRHVWVEVDGRLFMLDTILRFRGSEEDLYISLQEVEEFQRTRREVRSEFRETRRAASGQAIAAFEDQTGTAWDSDRVASGRPKRTKEANQELNEAKN